MKCKKCGKELKPGVKFCGFCGAPVELEKSIDKKKNKKVWVLGAGGVLLAASIVGIVASGVLVKKPGAEKKGAVTEEQDHADGGNKEEKETETIYLPSKTTVYDENGNVTGYTVCVYQQNEDGITGEEITYPADEGREAWSEKKNIKYDKYGREEWEYVFQIEDGVEKLDQICTYEYESDGSYYQTTRVIFEEFDNEDIGYLNQDQQLSSAERYTYYAEGINGNSIIGNYDRREYSYDEDGNIVSMILYDEDNKMESREETDYDQDGNILCIKSYDENGNIESREEYSYDENGRATSTQTYDSDNKITERTEYDYKNADATEYTVTTYDEENMPSYKIEYVYGDDGKLYKQYYYNIDDGKESLSQGFEHTYNERGEIETSTRLLGGENDEIYESCYEYEFQEFQVDLLENNSQKDTEIQEEQKNTVNGIYVPVKFKNFSADGAEGFWEEYSYEKKNGQIIGTGKMYFKNPNGNQECVGDYSITYDGQGRLLEKTFYDTDSSYTDRMTYSYEEDGSYMEENEYMGNKVRRTYSKDHVLLSEEEYDSDSGEWVSAKIENEYDQNGNIVKHREYDENSRLTLEAEYIYDENGKTGTIQSYDEQGNVSSVSHKVYDQTGNMLQSTKEENGETTETMYQRYDSYGNLLFYEQYGKTGKLVSASKTEYQMFPLENQ